MRAEKLRLAMMVMSLCLWGTRAFCSTNGTVTLQVTTEPTPGHFSPRHVLAIWIADATGHHVRTLESDGKHFGKYLVEWNKALTAGGKKKGGDAVTGATLQAHKTHVVKWDCRDAHGNLVPDGKYEIFVEFSEQNGKGSLFHLKFDKGPGQLLLEPKPEKYFKDIKLTYVPPAGSHGAQ